MIQAIQASVEVDEIKVPNSTNSGFGFDVGFLYICKFEINKV